MGEKSSEKSAKKRFLYSHEYYYQKIRGKNARNNFSRKSRIVRSKNVGKNIRENCKNIVFHINTNIVTKKGGEKGAKQFCQQHPNSASNKCWEKIVRKKREKRFFIFTRISLQKNAGKKTRETIFQKHTNSASKKWGKKDRREKG